MPGQQSYIVTSNQKELCKKYIDTHTTFIDLEEAFDSVPIILLYQVMRRIRIKKRIRINIIKSYTMITV